MNCNTCPYALLGECHFTYHFGIPFCTREELEGHEEPEYSTYTWSGEIPCQELEQNRHK